MRKPYGKSPSGKEVSKTKYINEWTVLYKTLENVLDVRVIAFDPSIQITDKNGRGSAEIPLWLAEKILRSAGYELDSMVSLNRGTLESRRG